MLPIGDQIKKSKLGLAQQERIVEGLARQFRVVNHHDTTSINSLIKFKVFDGIIKKVNSSYRLTRN